jgi:hypothetical protein
MQTLRGWPRGRSALWAWSGSGVEVGDGVFGLRIGRVHRELDRIVDVAVMRASISAAFSFVSV